MMATLLTTFALIIGTVMRGPSYMIKLGILHAGHISQYACNFLHPEFDWSQFLVC